MLGNTVLTMVYFNLKSNNTRKQTSNTISLPLSAVLSALSLCLRSRLSGFGSLSLTAPHSAPGLTENRKTTSTVVKRKKEKTVTQSNAYRSIRHVYLAWSLLSSCSPPRLSQAFVSETEKHQL